MIPTVIQVVPGDNFTAYIYFNDGSVRFFDASDLIKRGGVFEKLGDEDFFKNRMTVINDTLAWDITGDRNPCECIDLDPCKLHEECKVVPDPLEESLVAS